MADTVVAVGRTRSEAEFSAAQRTANLGAVMLGPIDFEVVHTFDGAVVQVLATVEILMDPAIPMLWHAHTIAD